MGNTEQHPAAISSGGAADENLREEARTLAILNRVGSAVAAELNLERAVQAVTDAATELTGAAFGSFFYNVTDADGERYMLYTLSGAPREAFAKFPLPRNTAVFGPTFKGEGIVRSDDVLKDPRYGKSGPYFGMPKGHLPVRSYLAVPVISRSGEVLGGLFFGHPEPGIFSARSERLLSGIAAQAAIAIDNGRLYQAAQAEIAERKRAEDALRASEDRLQHVNAELARRLGEIETGNLQVQDARRAALNLMEDAIQSRKSLEILNVRLRESESRFREMVDMLPAAVYTTDADGNITHFNPAAAEFSGRTPELGTDRWCVSWKLFHPDGTAMPHDQCPMAVTLKEGRIVSGAEAILERPDGTRRWFTPYPTPLRDMDGTITGGINMLVDITDRKGAEESRAVIAAIVESTDDAIISKSLDGIIATWNKGAEHLFGYTAKEAVGQPIIMLVPADRLQEEPEILARLRRGEHIEHFETVRVRKDGSSVEVSLTISPIKDRKGKVIGASKIARDISEFKQAQMRERLLTNELAHRGKNLLAVVQAIVSRSLSGKTSVAEARDTLNKRIQALSRSQSLLLSGGFEGARLAEIVGLEFEAFSERVEVSGPNLFLNPRSTQAFALLVHELATNATKHGALSWPQGRVAINWAVDGVGGDARFRFQWQERGGPPVAAPTRKGFGRVLIEKAVAQDFGAQPRIEFAPEGLSYRIDALLSAVGDGRP